MMKTKWSQLTQFAWEQHEPKWKQEVDKHKDELLQETGLSEETLEQVLHVLSEYRILA